MLTIPKTFRVTITKKLSISAILGNDTSSSWDLIFCRNLTDVEIVDLERLMSLLSNVHLTPSTPDAKAWVPSSSGGFSVKSFPLVLSSFSYSTLFYLTHFLWKSRAPYQVMAFAWLVAHKKTNTNDMLQLRRFFKALSPDQCILCRRSSEAVDHLFLYCPITLALWHRIFSQVGWRGFSQIIFVI